MTAYKFTIVIPTRNRAGTLHWCLKSCIEQDYDNYVIIVSDNNSMDNTREVVAAFNNPKIQYFNTGRSLSMSANWEFALEKVAGGYVTFLGDDDALMPHALLTANKYLNEFDVKAIIGRKDLYKWNNVAEVKQRGLLRYEVNRKTRVMYSHQQLDETLHRTFDYTKLPCIYNIGFVAMEVIDEIRSKTGNVFFRSSIPDVYSSIAITSVIEKYLYANESFVLSGLSAASNGNSLFNPDTDKSIIKNFQAENNFPFHPKLELNPTMAVNLAESLFQARDAGLDLPYEMTVRQVCELSLKEASYGKFSGSYETVRQSVENIVEKNGEGKDYYNYLIRKYPYKSWLRRNLKAYVESFNPNKIKNIADLSKAADNTYAATLINYSLNKNSYLVNNPLTIFFKWVIIYLNRARP